MSQGITRKAGSDLLLEDFLGKFESSPNRTQSRADIFIHAVEGQRVRLLFIFNARVEYLEVTAFAFTSVDFETLIVPLEAIEQSSELEPNSHLLAGMIGSSFFSDDLRIWKLQSGPVILVLALFAHETPREIALAGSIKEVKILLLCWMPNQV